MKYTGNTDAVHGKVRPGTRRFARLMEQHFGLVCIGIFANRPMRGNPNAKSVHATWRALDLRGTRAQRRAAIKFLADNYRELGIEAIHDYAGVSKPGTEQWGRGFKCSRVSEDRDGWRDFTRQDNAGTPGASSNWIHVELAPRVADNAQRLSEAFTACVNAPRGVDTP